MSKLYHAQQFARKIAKKSNLLRSLNRKKYNFQMRKARACLQEHGFEYTTEIQNAGQAANLDLFLMCGSLLGCVREGRYLEHDDDIDFGLLVTKDTDWSVVERALASTQFKKIREFACDGVTTEQAYASEDLSFDVFGLFPVEESDSLRLFYYTCPESMVFDERDQMAVNYIDIPSVTSFKTMVMNNGTEVVVPSNAEDILSTLYGPSWQIPDAKWIKGTGCKILDGAKGRRILFS